MWWPNDNNNKKDQKAKWKEDRDEDFSVDQQNNFPDNTMDIQDKSTNDKFNSISINQQQYNDKYNNDKYNIDNNDIDNNDNNIDQEKKEVIKKIEEFKEEIGKVQYQLQQSHLYMWILSIAGGLQAATFLGAIHLFGNGLLYGMLTGQLFGTKGYIKSSLQNSYRHSVEVGGFVFFYNGFSNSVRIIRREEVPSNHFIGGFLAGTVSSAIIGFSSYESTTNNSNVIQLKSDPSGVFKQYKAKIPMSKHLKIGFMMGTATLLWNLWSSSTKGKGKLNDKEQIER